MTKLYIQYYILEILKHILKLYLIIIINKKKLSQIKAIIIEEISIVLANLLLFISLLFIKINKKAISFGKFLTLLIGEFI